MYTVSKQLTCDFAFDVDSSVSCPLPKQLYLCNICRVEVNQIMYFDHRTDLQNSSYRSKTPFLGNLFWFAENTNTVFRNKSTESDQMCAFHQILTKIYDLVAFWSSNLCLHVYVQHCS